MTIPRSRQAPYPVRFHALQDGVDVDVGSERYRLSVVDCGELHLPSGKLLVCDPFVDLSGRGGEEYIDVPKGRFPVRVTLADVSDERDGSHQRHAYASLIFAAGVEVSRKMLCLAAEGVEPAPLGEDEMWGFGVDSGTACFADKESIARDMPDKRTWKTAIFDSGSEDAWTARLKDNTYGRTGIANIPLPAGDGTTNIVLVRAGWGDGVYPIVGGFAEDGALVAIHLDFLMIVDDVDAVFDPDEEKSELRSRVP